MAHLLATEYSQTMKVHLVTTQNLIIRGDTIKYLIDEQGLVHRHFNFNKAGLLLVRPDKYIGFTQKPICLTQFKEYLYLHNDAQCLSSPVACNRET